MVSYDISWKETAHVLEMSSPDTLRAQLARLGISDRSRVIVYNASDDFSHGTRVMLTLDYAGLGARSALLDGGLVAWKAAGLPLSTTVPPATVGTLSPLHIRPIIVDAAFVRSHVNAPGYRVLDGRRRCGMTAWSSVPGRGRAISPARKAFRSVR